MIKNCSLYHKGEGLMTFWTRSWRKRKLEWSTSSVKKRQKTTEEDENFPYSVKEGKEREEKRREEKRSLREDLVLSHFVVSYHWVVCLLWWFLCVSPLLSFVLLLFDSLLLRLTTNVLSVSISFLQAREKRLRITAAMWSTLIPQSSQENAKSDPSRLLKMRSSAVYRSSKRI